VTSQIPPDIVEYVLARDRERALVREAAVMGYVQGVMAAGGLSRVQIPRDSATVRLVVMACQTVRDGFPLLSGESGR
jgi:hypothetical protein